MPAPWDTGGVSTVERLSERLEFLQGTLEVLILRSLALGPTTHTGSRSSSSRNPTTSSSSTTARSIPRCSGSCSAGGSRPSGRHRRTPAAPSTTVSRRLAGSSCGRYVEMAAIRAGHGPRARFGRMKAMRAWWARVTALFSRNRIRPPRS